MRKLATIRKVLDIKPIPNADSIELAMIGGWQCVVKKGEFKIGDLGVYFEIDSFLPIDARFEFLRKSSYKTLADGSEGFRLRTVKFRGELSQGLLMPLSTFPEMPVDTYDVTSALHVKLYTPPTPACLSGDVVGPFPSCIPKTDAERIQNIPDYFSTMKDEEFEVSEKVDGTSLTCYFLNGKVGVCGRNWELKEDMRNAYWKIASYFIPAVKELHLNIALQGELCGEGIQSNPLKLKGQRLFLFHVYDLDESKYYMPDQRWELFEKIKCDALDHVPLISKRVKVFQELDTMEKMLDYAAGKSCVCSQMVTSKSVQRRVMVQSTIEREGLVFKSWSHPEICFKAVSNTYLLGEK
jgi:RNA ligase (TIGR02306 family)